MKKLILVGLFLVGCSQSSNETKTPDIPNITEDSEVIVDISKLSSSNLSLNELTTPIVDGLDFGPVAFGAEVSKKLILKNTSSSNLPVPLSIDDSSQGFKIKLNRCAAILNAGKSCEMTLSFSARSKLDGSYATVLTIPDTPELMALNLSAQVSGNPAPDANAPATLSASLDSPFYQAGQVSGSIISRVMTITNNGPGYIPAVQFTIPPEYVVRINRCGSLKVGKSCTITLAFKDSRNSVPPQNSAATVTAYSSSGNVSSPVGVVLASNSPAGASNYTLTILFENNSIISPINFSSDGTSNYAHILSNSNQFLSLSKPAGSSVNFFANSAVGTTFAFIYNNIALDTNPLVMDSDKTVYVRLQCATDYSPNSNNTACEPNNQSIPNISFDLAQCQTKFGTFGTQNFNCYPINGNMMMSSVSGSWDLSSMSLPSSNVYFVISTEGMGCGAAYNANPFVSLPVQGSIQPFLIQRPYGMISLIIYEDHFNNGYRIDNVLNCQELGNFWTYESIPNISTNFNVNQGASNTQNGWILPDSFGAYSVSFDFQVSWINQFQHEFFRTYSYNFGPYSFSSTTPTHQIGGGDNLTYTPTTPLLENQQLGNSMSVYFSTLYYSDNAMSNQISGFQSEYLLIAKPRVIDVYTIDLSNNQDQIFDSEDSLQVSTYNLAFVSSIILKKVSNNQEFDITSYCHYSNGIQSDNIGYNSFYCDGFFPAQFGDAGPYQLILRGSLGDSIPSSQTISPLL